MDFPPPSPPPERPFQYPRPPDGMFNHFSHPRQMPNPPPMPTLRPESSFRPYPLPPDGTSVFYDPPRPRPLQMPNPSLHFDPRIPVQSYNPPPKKTWFLLPTDDIPRLGENNLNGEHQSREEQEKAEAREIWKLKEREMERKVNEALALGTARSYRREREEEERDSEFSRTWELRPEKPQLQGRSRREGKPWHQEQQEETDVRGSCRDRSRERLDRQREFDRPPTMTVREEREAEFREFDRPPSRMTREETEADLRKIDRLKVLHERLIGVCHQIHKEMKDTRRIQKARITREEREADLLEYDKLHEQGTMLWERLQAEMRDTWRLHKALMTGGGGEADLREFDRLHEQARMYWEEMQAKLRDRRRLLVQARTTPEEIEAEMGDKRRLHEQEVPGPTPQYPGPPRRAATERPTDTAHPSDFDRERLTHYIGTQASGAARQINGNIHNLQLHFNGNIYLVNNGSSSCGNLPDHGSNAQSARVPVERPEEVWIAGDHKGATPGRWISYK
ncbi:hypothetical protein BJ508DRAFT_419062 [Ascobolus immersus RN42]|uniref:Uncharacterized protein n=1 Tax=Ascobolus immersus RN42 TaxID=1160509 RepID=A0A3N4HKK8_ASCIM|nr:hypothetical protein BJ508DRAFT_419062 [Ascobolus immersus RN42]